MADEILVKYKSDLSAFEAKLNELDKRLKATEKTGKDAFKGIEDQSKKAASSVEESGNKIATSFKSISEGMLAALSTGAILLFAQQATKAFAEAEKGDQRLLAALKGNQAAFEKLNKQAEELQDKLGIDDDVIKAAQTFLAVQGRTVTQIENTVNAAKELSAVTGDSLQAAVEKLDQTYEGSIGRLGKLDAGFKDLTKEQLANGAAIDLINEKYKGFSDKTLDNTQTRIEKTKTFFGNLLETIGSGFGFIIEQAGVAANIVAAFIERVFNIKDDAKKSGEDTGEAYFEGVQASIGKASRQEFDAVAAKLKADAEASLSGVNQTVAAMQNIVDTSTNPKEIADMKKAIQDFQKSNVAGEQSRVDRVIQIIESERARKKSIFNEQAADEAKANQEALEAKKKADQEFQDFFESLVDENKKIVDIDYANLKKSLADKEKAEKEFQDFFEQSMNENEKIVNIDYDNKLKAEKEFQDKKKAIREAEFDSAKSIINAIADLENIGFDKRLQALQDRSDAINEAFDKEASALEKKNERGAISDLEYARQKELLDKKREVSEAAFAKQQRKLAHDQAVVNKTFAIFNIILNTAQGIMAALASTPPNVPLSIAIGIAGASQFVVASQLPIPALKDGTNYVKLNGRPKGRDTIPAWLDEGERVVSREKNKKNWEIYEALDNNRFHELVHKKYVVPVIIDFQKRQAEKAKSEHAKQIGAAMISSMNGLTEREMKKLWDRGITINNLPDREESFIPGKYGTW